MAWWDRVDLNNREAIISCPYSPLYDYPIYRGNRLLLCAMTLLIVAIKNIFQIHLIISYVDNI